MCSVLQKFTHKSAQKAEMYSLTFKSNQKCIWENAGDRMRLYNKVKWQQ